MSSYSTTNYSLIFLLLLSLTLYSGCKLENDLFTVDCEQFDNQKLAWFPYETGDVIKFNGTDSLQLERDFVVADQIVFSDTSYQTLFEGELCTPYAQFIAGEENNDTTALNLRIIDLVNDSENDLAVLMSIADFNATSIFAQQLIVRTDGSFTQGNNSELTVESNQTIGGVLYEEVIRLELLTEPGFPGQFTNDIRTIWIAKNAGIVRFEDEVKGVFELEP